MSAVAIDGDPPRIEAVAVMTKNRRESFQSEFMSVAFLSRFGAERGEGRLNP